MINLEKNICVLGSTGSIGTQTLEVAKELNLNVEALSSFQNINLLEKQIRIFKPKIAAVVDSEKASILKDRVKDTSTKILSGIEGICQAATVYSAETVVTALSGISGLLPTYEAIKSGKNIALANKETLVTGGNLIKKIAKEKNVSILPVDSEHSAIFQCLQGSKDIKKLVLTASGGPFFGKTRKDLENVSLSEALNHPSWSMGKKITVDSATMMNKGFEIIEAAHLFDVSIEDIEVLIHRQSIVHSMVEFQDGSFLAQMSYPSMKMPIQYALTYPNKVKCNAPSLNLTDYKEINFFKPDYEVFESIEICKKSFKDNTCVALNAANEKAVELFLESKIKFIDIVKLVKLELEKFKSYSAKTLEEIISLDKKVKDSTEKDALNLKIKEVKK